MCWEASYKDAAGSPFIVLGTATNECPVSLISDESKDLIQSFAKATLLYKSLGASPYGGDLNKWPPRTVDAFVILQDEYNSVESQKIPKKPRGQQ